ncbi:MAG: acyloxyacyl hydrolase [Burkholderiales bacterium]|nr:acyloxyacyl hydrolase [Burkholderiales bacterium]
MKKTSRLLAVLCCLCPSLRALAYDGVALEIGTGDSVDMVRAAYQWDWNRQWLNVGNWHVGGYWDAALGYWRGDDTPGSHRNIVDIGLTPVFRLQQTHKSGISPYLEAAVGFHLLSHTSISEQQLATAFQFGDHLGIGMRFGEKHRYDLAFRYQHLSNGSIKQPNDGISFGQVRFGYWF